MQKLFVLGFFLAMFSWAAADESLLRSSIGPSGIGIREADDSSGPSCEFVNVKSHHVLGNLGLGDVSNVSVHVSWNKTGTRVAALVYYGTKLSELCLYEIKNNQTVQQVKFDQPDPVAICEAKTKSKFPYADNSGYDSSDVGAWTDENTVDLLSGETKEIYAANADNPTGTVSLFVPFRVHLEDSKAHVSIIKLIGPISDNENGDKGSAFLQAWEKQNGITDSASGDD